MKHYIPALIALKCKMLSNFKTVKGEMSSSGQYSQQTARRPGNRHLQGAHEEHQFHMANHTVQYNHPLPRDEPRAGVCLSSPVNIAGIHIPVGSIFISHSISILTPVQIDEDPVSIVVCEILHE